MNRTQVYQLIAKGFDCEFNSPRLISTITVYTSSEEAEKRIDRFRRYLIQRRLLRDDDFLKVNIKVLELFSDE